MAQRSFFLSLCGKIFDFLVNCSTMMCTIPIHGTGNQRVVQSHGSQDDSYDSQFVFVLYPPHVWCYKGEFPKCSVGATLFTSLAQEMPLSVKKVKGAVPTATSL